MELYKAIAQILKEAGHPMMIKEITLVINSNEYYGRSNKPPLGSSEVCSIIKNYPSLFINVNGLIIPSNNIYWINLFNSFLRLKETLRGIFSDADIQFIIATLFFYKRLIDNENYPIFFNSSESSLDKLLDCKLWISSLQKIEDLYIAPEKVFLELSDFLSKLDTSKCKEIIYILKNINTKPFNDLEYGNIYEYLLYQNTKEYSGYEHSTPETIRMLLPELLDAKENKRVYDPVAGFGGLLSKVYESENNLSLFGTEINTRIAQLGNMNLIMHGSKSAIVAKNCFLEIGNEDSYDYILGDLPINGITNSYEYYLLYEKFKKFKINAPKSGKGFNSLVLFSFFKLSNVGKAVITISDSFLTKGGKEKEIRNILLKNDAIEAIISLPRGTYRPYTEAKPSILIINNNKPLYLKEKIKFIGANIIEEDKKSLLLNIEEIVREYKNEKPNGKITQIVNIEDLKEDLNLSAEVYNTQFSLANEMLKEERAKLLKDIVTIKTGSQPVKDEIIPNGKLPIVKIENLSKEILDMNLEISTISSRTNEENKYQRSVISQDCILIAKIGDSLKPTIYKPTDEYPRILLHSGVLALITKNLKIDMEYLYYQLNTTFVEEQIISKKKKALIPFFNIKEVEEIVIPYDDINIQKKFVKLQKADLIAIETKKLEEKKKNLGYEVEIKEAETNIVRTITHQLKHNLSNIDTYVRKIKEIINKNNIGDLKEYAINDPILLPEDGFEIPENYSLEQTSDILIKKSSLLNHILTDVAKAIYLELNYSNENIFDILNELKNEYKDLAIEIKGEENLELNISKSHIQDMFETLINNALQHSNLIKEKLKMTFTIKKGQDIVIIEYRNNGKPLNISESEFKSIATKSRSSNGTGIGGYYINKIIEAHSGSLTITENLNSGIHMTIELPLKHNNHE